MNAYTFRMPAGIPGAISRAAGQATVEPQVYDGANAFARYGMFGKISAEKFTPLANGDAGAVTYGLLVRPYPANSSQDGLGASTPATSGIANVLRRGYASVLLAKGAAAKGAQVYVVTTAGGTVAIGDIVSSAAPAGGGTGVAVPNCVFTGPADANGIAEVAFNI